MFDSVVDVVFQSIFGLKMYQNNIFFYFLNFIFNISTPKKINSKKKKGKINTQKT